MPWEFKKNSYLFANVTDMVQINRHSWLMLSFSVCRGVSLFLMNIILIQKKSLQILNIQKIIINLLPYLDKVSFVLLVFMLVWHKVNNFSHLKVIRLYSTAFLIFKIFPYRVSQKHGNSVTNLISSF